MRRTFIGGIAAFLIFAGAGCVPSAAPASAAPEAASPATAADPYEGWGEIRPGSVVSLRIPPGCEGDPGAGNIYVICPTADDPRPDPVMHTSSDGVTVNIGRATTADGGPVQWEYYEKAVASLRVLEPLDHDIHINVEH